MTSHPELEFTKCATLDKLRELEHDLELIGGWVKADSLSYRMFYMGGERGKRAIRALAEHSTQIISGNAGYRHRKHATEEEIAHFLGRLRSQMRRSAERIARFEAI